RPAGRDAMTPPTAQAQAPALPHPAGIGAQIPSTGELVWMMTAYFAGPALIEQDAAPGLIAAVLDEASGEIADAVARTLWDLEDVNPLGVAERILRDLVFVAPAGGEQQP